MGLGLGLPIHLDMSDEAEMLRKVEDESVAMAWAHGGGRPDAWACRLDARAGVGGGRPDAWSWTRARGVGLQAGVRAAAGCASGWRWPWR